MTDKNEKKQKREYRKGNPLTLTEYTNRYKEKKKKNKKEMRIFIPIEIASRFTQHCRQIKKSRSEIISKLIDEYTNNMDSIS